jgi:Type VI secretion system (T6SS), amidase effector protein 4
MEFASSTWQLDSALSCRCLLATTNPDCQWVACPDLGQLLPDADLMIEHRPPIVCGNATGVTFDIPWKNYPDGHPCVDRKTGRAPEGYSDQCAMRVGDALERSGVSFASFHGKRSPCAPKSTGMVAGAQELANWLGPTRFSGCPKPDSPCATTQESVQNRERRAASKR